MRPFEFLFLTLIGGIAVSLPQFGFANDDRNYVFEDEDGHLVLRFVGVGHGELTSTQIDEISNAEFSTMVHDRIRADLRFDSEPPDRAWASQTEVLIRRHLDHHLADFLSIDVACRSASCRLILEHGGGWDVSRHSSLMETVQATLERLVEEHASDFEQVFLITAYFQQAQIPHVKAFLQRRD